MAQRSLPDAAGAQATPASVRQVASFRLARQHLAERSSRESWVTVLAGMGGAQAQIMSAAKLSLWARVRDMDPSDIDRALSADRTIARSACMRRTLHLVPSTEIAVFVRGTAKRAARDLRWIVNKGATHEELDRVIDAVLEAFGTPRTRTELIETVAASLDVQQTRAADGWWGNTRKLPSIHIGPIACPPNYLLALASARGIICYADPRGNEPTFVRADAWLPDVPDLSIEGAEEELLRRYLRAYGPATPADFAAWTGIRTSDAREIWQRVQRELGAVVVDGRPAWVLASDVDELLRADVRRPHVRLLPYFDAYLLGHADRTYVAPEHQARVYRKQGWVSAVLLVDGAVKGTWSHEITGMLLEVFVEPLGRLSRAVLPLIRKESELLAPFFGCDGAIVTIAGA